jgi:hypothetical protein
LISHFTTFSILELCHCLYFIGSGVICFLWTHSSTFLNLCCRWYYKLVWKTRRRMVARRMWRSCWYLSSYLCDRIVTSCSLHEKKNTI